MVQNVQITWNALMVQYALLVIVLVPNVLKRMCVQEEKTAQEQIRGARREISVQLVQVARMVLGAHRVNLVRLPHGVREVVAVRLQTGVLQEGIVQGLTMPALLEAVVLRVRAITI